MTIQLLLNNFRHAKYVMNRFTLNNIPLPRYKKHNENNTSYLVNDTSNKLLYLSNVFSDHELYSMLNKMGDVDKMNIIKLISEVEEKNKYSRLSDMVSSLNMIYSSDSINIHILVNEHYVNNVHNLY